MLRFTNYWKGHVKAANHNLKVAGEDGEYTVMVQQHKARPWQAGLKERYA